VPRQQRVRNAKGGVNGPLDDFALGDALANVGEVECVEDFACGEECVGGVEVGAEERATDEGAMDSNGHLHRDHEHGTRSGSTIPWLVA